jgi:hypothetical protein
MYKRFLVFSKLKSVILLKFHPGLPDGIFGIYQKSQFLYIWEGVGMEIVGLFYGILVYFRDVWYFL